MKIRQAIAYYLLALIICFILGCVSIKKGELEYNSFLNDQGFAKLKYIEKPDGETSVELEDYSDMKTKALETLNKILDVAN